MTESQELTLGKESYTLGLGSYDDVVGRCRHTDLSLASVAWSSGVLCHIRGREGRRRCEKQEPIQSTRQSLAQHSASVTTALHSGLMSGREC